MWPMWSEIVTAGPRYKTSHRLNCVESHYGKSHNAILGFCIRNKKLNSVNALDHSIGKMQRTDPIQLCPALPACNQSVTYQRSSPIGRVTSWQVSLRYRRGELYSSPHIWATTLWSSCTLQAGRQPDLGVTDTGCYCKYLVSEKPLAAPFKRN